VPLSKCCCYGQITEDETSAACSTCGGDHKRIQGFGGENLKKINHCENPGVDGTIILKWVLKDRMRSCRLNSSGSGQGQWAGCCEHCNEPSGSIKCGEFD
jgi:hypothetical protein